jgi:hypothetical protein
MFLPPVFTVEFLGHDLVFIEAEWLIASVIWYLFLVGAIMYLANLRQPTPSAPQWAANVPPHTRHRK